ncbi:SAM domain-containing protein [Patescibacteria group bacterium]|nr:SAM domain-containing protein [Patescibacteria group bacterium]
MENVEAEDIDGIALLQLTPEDLKFLGLTQMGPRKRLEFNLERIKKVFQKLFQEA